MLLVGRTHRERDLVCPVDCPSQFVLHGCWTEMSFDLWIGVDLSLRILYNIRAFKLNAMNLTWQYRALSESVLDSKAVTVRDTGSVDPGSRPFFGSGSGSSILAHPYYRSISQLNRRTSNLYRGRGRRTNFSGSATALHARRNNS